MIKLQLLIESLDPFPERIKVLDSEPESTMELR